MLCPVITGVSEAKSFPRTVFSLFFYLVHLISHPFGPVGRVLGAECGADLRYLIYLVFVLLFVAA